MQQDQDYCSSKKNNKNKKKKKKKKREKRKNTSITRILSSAIPVVFLSFALGTTTKLQLLARFPPPCVFARFGHTLCMPGKIFCALQISFALCFAALHFCRGNFCRTPWWLLGWRRATARAKLDQAQLAWRSECSGAKKHTETHRNVPN